MFLSSGCKGVGVAGLDCEFWDVRSPWRRVIIVRERWLRLDCVDPGAERDRRGGYMSLINSACVTRVRWKISQTRWGFPYCLHVNYQKPDFSYGDPRRGIGYVTLRGSLKEVVVIGARSGGSSDPTMQSQRMGG